MPEEVPATDSQTPAGPLIAQTARPGMQRRLSAVLVADVAGYARLMQTDEDGTHARMMWLRAELIQPRIAGHHGRLVKDTGDGFLAMFDNAHDATQCAVALQRELSAAAADQPANRRIYFRMGVNVAEVILEGGDIYGDGVNVAARLQTYAEPGGVIVSDVVVEHVGPRAGLRFVDLGDLPLRNITHPVRTFSVRVADAPAHVPAEAIVASEARPSIVVLPFREQPARPGEEYFAEGIVDDIIHGLSGLKELFVISRGSTLGYRDSTIDVRSIGRELGVRYVLHGSVRRSDSAMRIRTELCNADSGTILNVDQYDGVLTDLFDLQHQIATRVVMTIAPHVRERERQLAMRKHPQNMTAYDLVLQALGPLFRMDYPSFSLARGLLQQAIAHDPNYAPAHSYASYWHLLRVGQGWSTDAAADAEEAMRTAKAAIELDENDALALAIYGHVHSYLMKDFATAVELQDRAIEAGPNCAMAWTLSSVARGYLGQGPAAVLRAEHGLQLSPRGPHLVYYEHVLAQAHYINGNYDEAVAWGRKAYRRNDRLTSNLRCLAASLVAIGEIEEARQIAGKLMQFHPGLRLNVYARQTPLQGRLRDTFVERLRMAGVPE